jgi:hypothetical protein
VAGRSAVVFLVVLVADLVGDLDLIFALFGQLVIADGAPEGFLRLAHYDVLPRSRPLIRTVVAIAHTASVEEPASHRAAPRTAELSPLPAADRQYE